MVVSILVSGQDDDPSGAGGTQVAEREQCAPVVLDIRVSGGAA